MNARAMSAIDHHNVDKISRAFTNSSDHAERLRLWKEERDYRAKTEERIFESLLRDGELTRKGYTQKVSVPIDSFSDDDMSDSPPPSRRHSARRSSASLHMHEDKQQPPSDHDMNTRHSCTKRRRTE